MREETVLNNFCPCCQKERKTNYEVVWEDRICFILECETCKAVWVYDLALEFGDIE